MKLIDQKKKWLKLYESAPKQLDKLKTVRGVASTFNVNIDAVIKLDAEKLQRIYGEISQIEVNADSELNISSISSPLDLFTAFIHCFKSGIAKELLISDTDTYRWVYEHVGFDRLQMGGQAGIIANVMAVCGVQQVYAHAASLPSAQAQLFIDEVSILATDAFGELSPIRNIDRKEDAALIHWILEFNQGDTIQTKNQTFVCPKSNRLIATYDPLNCELHIEKGFAQKMRNPQVPIDYILISGYQMLTEPTLFGNSAHDIITASIEEIALWKKAHPEALVHFEFASTQDLSVRQALLTSMTGIADSIGCNEQELIDLLEAMGETALASSCRKTCDSVHLFEGLCLVYNRMKPRRIQLHMFGLFLTLTSADSSDEELEKARDGMILAATLSTTKAGTGSLENKNQLLWGHGRQVADEGLRELEALDQHLKSKYGASSISDNGIYRNQKWAMVAIPTILIDKPISLVGMGDTISSVSLVGAC